MTVPVSEVFGPVWQGEGPYAGRRCSFLRLGLCNLHCEWCDTPYTWDRARYDIATENPERDAASITAALATHDTALLVVSGGEPLIHRDNDTLRDALHITPHEVHVETNGTLTPSAWMWRRVGAWIVSPKVGQDADPWKRKIKPDVLARYSECPDAHLKVVARTADDVHALAAVIPTWGTWAPERVWVMPEGETPETILPTARLIADAAATYGWNLTLRQHALMFGSQRGV